MEALAVKLTQNEGELIQEKFEVKKLVNFLKQVFNMFFSDGWIYRMACHIQLNYLMLECLRLVSVFGNLGEQLETISSIKKMKLIMSPKNVTFWKC